MPKVIKFRNNEQLIRQSLDNDRRAQKLLYDKYAPKMLSLCCFYISDRQRAEEVMLKGFYKVFTKLSGFRKQCSFESWIRRIMVNQCISLLRAKNKLQFTDNMDSFEGIVDDESEMETQVEDIRRCINYLPQGAKVVFNLYVMEGMKHIEIAKKLGITTGTSKTQLHRARKSLQKMIRENKMDKHGTT